MTSAQRKRLAVKLKRMLDPLLKELDAERAHAAHLPGSNLRELGLRVNIDALRRDLRDDLEVFEQGCTDAQLAVIADAADAVGVTLDHHIGLDDARDFLAELVNPGIRDDVPL